MVLLLLLLLLLFCNILALALVFSLLLSTVFLVRFAGFGFLSPLLPANEEATEEVAVADFFRTDAVRIIFVADELAEVRVGVEPALRFRSSTGTMHFRFSLLETVTGNDEVDDVVELLPAAEPEVEGSGNADGLMTACTDILSFQFLDEEEK